MRERELTSAQQGWIAADETECVKFLEWLRAAGAAKIAELQREIEYIDELLRDPEGNRLEIKRLRSNYKD